MARIIRNKFNPGDGEDFSIWRETKRSGLKAIGQITKWFHAPSGGIPTRSVPQSDHAFFFEVAQREQAAAGGEVVRPGMAVLVGEVKLLLPGGHVPHFGRWPCGRTIGVIGT